MFRPNGIAADLVDASIGNHGCGSGSGAPEALARNACSVAGVAPYKLVLNGIWLSGYD